MEGGSVTQETPTHLDLSACLVSPGHGNNTKIQNNDPIKMQQVKPEVEINISNSN